MKIQGILDLSGFELQNFCIQNYTDKANVANLGRGRKFFFTGNSTDQDYHRELIYDGSSWRATAYLDDIDKITNGKGSLGTRVKALEDMLNVDSAEAVVSTWEEIQAFLDNVKEGTDLMTMLDDKLSISKGGTITGNLTVKTTSWGAQLKVDGDNTQAGIGFYHDGTNIGYLVTYAPNKLAWYDVVSSVAHTILHAGNFNDIARPLASGTWGIDISGKSAGIISVPSEQKGYGVFATIGQYATSSEPEYGKIYVGSDSNYNVLSVPQLDGIASLANIMNLRIRFSPSFYSELAVLPNERKLWFRSVANNQASSWKTIAFTDSDITGNAKGAYNLICNYNDKPANVAYVSGSQFYVGDTIYPTIATNILGKEIRLRTGESAATAMTITEEGNIEIAGANNVYTRKLAVGIGSAHIIATTTGIPALGTPAGNSLLVGSLHYGLQIGTSTNDEASSIQAQRFDAATALALNLNPLGGAVNVGEGGLNVTGDVTLSHGNYIKFKDSSGTNSISVLSLNGTYFTLGQGAAGAGCDTYLYGRSIYFKTGSSQNTALTINSNGAGVFNNTIIADKYNGQGNIAGAAIVINKAGRRFGIGASSDDITSISLGLVSDEYGTWSSEHIIIESSGLATFNGGALIPTGQKLTIGDANGDHATIEYDSIAKAIKVDGNMYTTGTNASGGKADDQSGNTGGGNAEVYKYDLDWGEQVYEIQNVKGDVNVNVQVYEWNGNGNSWDMILTDVSVTANIITVTFGSPTSVDHMVTVV